MFLGLVMVKWLEILMTADTDVAGRSSPLSVRQSYSSSGRRNEVLVGLICVWWLFGGFTPTYSVTKGGGRWTQHAYKEADFNKTTTTKSKPKLCSFND